MPPKFVDLTDRDRLVIAIASEVAAHFLRNGSKNAGLQELVSAEVIGSLSQLEEKLSPPPPGGPKLSLQQTEVLKWVLLGKKSREIGLELGISPRTVETIRARVMGRFGANSVATLFAAAVRAGYPVG